MRFMQLFIPMLLVFCWNTLLQAQEGFGTQGFEPEKAECISPAQYETIWAAIEQSRTELKKRNPEIFEKNVQRVSFTWPLRQASGQNDPSYYGISNFVDHNKNYPNQLRDYNCGTRTYDLASGYSHQGTDIYIYPFPWHKMRNNHVEVIAAAAGRIIYKSDGNFDMNCAIGNNGNWNAVYVQHSDGSIAWYGHLKNGSLTTKAVGASVAQGEYLGRVGSSGSSTGPHLHFEVYDNTNKLIDPYSGSCNNIGSWWASQKPYYESSVNKIMTHSAHPVFPSCPNEEVINASNNFEPGKTVYCYAYLHDQQSGHQVTFKIYRPDNVQHATWTGTANTFYSSSHWYYYFTLPTNAQQGTWRYTLTYLGRTYTHNFTVATPCNAPSTAQLSATSITTSAARLNCTVTGVTHYAWSYRRSGTSTWSTPQTTTTNYLNISGLATGSTYEYVAAVWCGSKWSDWSAVRTFTTTAAGCSPPTASQFYASSITRNSARLNCSITGASAYDWSYRSSTGAWIEVPGTYVNYVNISGLLPNTTYYYVAAVRCGSVWSTWSAVKSFTTANTLTDEEAITSIDLTATTEEATQEPISVAAYPIPAHDILNVQLQLTQPDQITLYLRDVTGRIIQSMPLGNKEAGTYLENIDLKNTTPGMYVLDVVGTKSKKVLKIIVR